LWPYYEIIFGNTKASRSRVTFVAKILFSRMEPLQIYPTLILQKTYFLPHHILKNICGLKSNCDIITKYHNSFLPYLLSVICLNHLLSKMQLPSNKLLEVCTFNMHPFKSIPICFVLFNKLFHNNKFVSKHITNCLFNLQIMHHNIYKFARLTSQTYNIMKYQ
jgi:hypothetical protein